MNDASPATGRAETPRHEESATSRRSHGGRDYLSVLVGALPVSVVSFLITQDLRVLNPRHIGWLWGSGDISSSFIQWLYFRETPLGLWPLTVNPAYGAPWTKTIIFSDTPPIFALPMKFLTSWLEGPVQYTGIQILLSTYLLVLFSALFVQRLTSDVWAGLAGGLLASVSPMLLFRDVFYHYSLNIMWVIPAALYLVVRRDAERSWWPWGVLAFVTLTWMPYFVVCVLVPWIWNLATRVATREARAKEVARALIWIACAVAAAAVVDGLWFNYSSTEGFGLGYYNANLLSLVNPMATPSSVWSRVLPSADVATDGQYEGFAYLGVGVLILFAIAIMVAVTQRRAPRLLWSRATMIAVLGTVLTCVVLSWGFTVTIGRAQLWSWAPPEWTGILLSTFRSSGRFMLVAGLALTLLSVALLSRMMRPVLVVVLVLSAALLTILDAWPQVDKNRLQQGVDRSLTPGVAEAGLVLDSYGIERVTFVEPENSAYQWKMDILGAAALRNIPVNDAFVARPNLERLSAEGARTRALFDSRAPKPGEMWVLYPSTLQDETNRLIELSQLTCVRKLLDAVIVLGVRCGGTA
jgi:Family of unknown function (DUF6311)